MKKGISALIAYSAITAASAGPIYRCTANGKTAYSDAPCVGAKEIEVTPTEGMNKWTGTERKSMDQMQRETTKARRDALEKGLNLPKGHFEKSAKYSHLQPSEQRDCRRLEAEIATLKSEKPVNETALYVTRSQFFKLKC